MSVPRDERLSAGRVFSHLVVMVAVAAIMGVLVAGLAIPFTGVLGIGATNVAKAMDNLPAELETDPLPQKTRMLDADGNVIATLYDENRVNVTLDQVSRTMVKAIIAIEDSRFYEHGALDLRGTLRALVTNQASSGTVQGGSSITQQMVKLTLVQQADGKAERKAATADTYQRKLKELRYAIAFEQHHSKDWILERYLNIAYFGDGTYGIQSAARHYFNVNAKKLNLRQSAVLAGLVKNPTGYDPTNSPDRAIERRNVVLDRMAQLEVISRAKAAKVKRKGLGLHVIPAKNGCLYSSAPFFCDYVTSYLLHDPALGKKVGARKRLLKTGGLTIHTTVDMTDQKAADSAVAGHVDRTDQAVGAMAMVEPGTGEVRALAQSRPMGNDEADGQTYLNYAVPTEYGDSAGFQAGSTFKPFVLATAVTDGLPLTTTFNAPQSMVLPQDEFANCDGAPGFVGEWDVSSSTSSGSMDAVRGTRESVNTYFAMLERATGVCDPYRLAKKMGVKLTDPKGDAQGNGAERVVTFTLGTPNASPLEMAEAYATFAARGKHCDSRPVTSIDDANGTMIKEYPATCSQVMPPNTADSVNYVLRGVQEPGGFGYDLGHTGLPVPSAAKTGTTQDGKSVWYVGYTPQLATAAMIAGASKVGNRPIPLAGQTIGGNYISGVSGSGFAGPMWAAAMQAIQGTFDDIDFVAPSQTTPSGTPTLVPTTSGMSVEGAISTLEAAGFRGVRAGSAASASPVGTVAYTSPSGGATVPVDTPILVYESTGQAPPPPKHGGRGGNGGNGGGGNGGSGGGRDAGQRRPRSLTSAAQPELAAYLCCHRATVGAALDLRRHHAHHLAHRLHALVGRADLGDRGGDQGDDLVGAELGRKVVGDHGGLGGLLGGHLGPAAVGEGGRRLAPLLGLGREHPDDVVVAELARLLAGHLGVGDRREHHPDRRGTHLVAGLDGGGEIRAETVLELAHSGHCGSLGAVSLPAVVRRTATGVLGAGAVAGVGADGVRDGGGTRLHAATGAGAGVAPGCPRAAGAAPQRHPPHPGPDPQAGVAGRARRAGARPGRRHGRQPRASRRRARRPGLARRPAGRPGSLRLRVERLLLARPCATRSATCCPTTAPATPTCRSCPGATCAAISPAPAGST